MNWIDYVIIAIIVLSALVGLARGLVREVLSLGVWIAALAVAWIFHREVAELLTMQLSQPSARIAVAFAALVFVTLILGAILGALLTRLIDRTGLTGIDRMLGLVFGAARGGVIVAMAVFLVALTPLPEDAWWRESILISDFQVLADWILSQTPADLQAWMKQL